MESREGSPAHDPNDPRGGGGPGGALDPLGQEEWRKREELRRAQRSGEPVDQDPDEEPGPFEGEVRAYNRRGGRR